MQDLRENQLPSLQKHFGDMKAIPKVTPAKNKVNAFKTKQSSSQNMKRRIKGTREFQKQNYVNYEYLNNYNKQEQNKQGENNNQNEVQENRKP